MTGSLTVKLHPVWMTGGYRYNVTRNGERIVSLSRDPETDLAPARCLPEASRAWCPCSMVRRVSRGRGSTSRGQQSFEPWRREMLRAFARWYVLSHSQRAEGPPLVFEYPSMHTALNFGVSTGLRSPRLCHSKPSSGPRLIVACSVARQHDHGAPGRHTPY
jgi:hypothetical protein